MTTYSNGQCIEVKTPSGWKPGKYLHRTADGKHIIECVDLWYGPLSMNDTSCIRPRTA